MAYRFKQTGVVVPIAGTSIPHGLGATPDEYSFALRGAPAAGAVFFSSLAPVDATNVNLSAVSTGTVDVFASVSHSLVK